MLHVKSILCHWFFHLYALERGQRDNKTYLNITNSFTFFFQSVISNSIILIFFFALDWFSKLKQIFLKCHNKNILTTNIWFNLWYTRTYIRRLYLQTHYTQTSKILLDHAIAPHPSQFISHSTFFMHHVILHYISAMQHSSCHSLSIIMVVHWWLVNTHHHAHVSYITIIHHPSILPSTLSS